MREQRSATLLTLSDEPTLVGETIADLAVSPICVGTDAPLLEVRHLLVDNRVPAVVVIDDDRALVGVITRTDVLRTVTRDATASDAMCTKLVSLPANASIAEASALVAQERVGQILVVEEDASLLGVVSALDILSYFVSGLRVREL